VQECLDELTEVHQFVHRTLKDRAASCCGRPACPAACPRTRPFRWPLRQLQCGPRQERVPHGPGPPLRPAHADHLGHPLQLVAARREQRAVFR
jgi:hypothetical protein